VPIPRASEDAAESMKDALDGSLVPNLVRLNNFQIIRGDQVKVSILVSNVEEGGGILTPE